jgi:hypothetical protein
MAMDEIMLRMLQLSGKGYVCSQILMKLALELRDEENPALVRAMAGPGYGCGSGSATCGALVGGCCVLALYTGDGRRDGGRDGAEAELGLETLRPMQAALTDWFEERVGREDGGTICDQIVGAEGPAASRQRCGNIVAEIHTQIMAILTAHGIDPIGV